MAWIGAAITAGAGILGSQMSANAQGQANKKNLQIAREQMAFQERMSNTAVTRRMRDLKVAGINPILAGRMEASSPAGASANMLNKRAGASADFREAAMSAMNYKRIKQEMKNLEAAEEKLRAETFTERERRRNLESDTRLKTQNIDYLLDQSSKLLQEIGLLKSQRPGANAEAEFWKKLNDGSLGGTGKGLLQFAPLIKILTGK